ncbi:ribosomal protein L6, alpha-beta domain-containing protein [Neurospora hispaniola]|uniref:Large ribosomal subunit protein uL6m n=1 Tax=Neurospora hispaniola TaxID=588809 RepID=A0AAJ0I7S2_9PEZI|nr:ribosomal protein L6, alpha-beta domain-containing protein [Neurospora hispaniola]
MFAPSRRRVLEAVASSSSSSVVTLPGFLVPAFQQTAGAAARRNFSATTTRPSKLGRTPLSIPPGVEITVGEPFVKRDMTQWKQQPKRKITVQGPLGQLEMDIPDFIKIDHDAEARRATLSVANRDEKEQREMWGTTWAYLNRFIMGVSEGHTAVLRLVGIGYRATIDTRPEKEEYPGQQFVCLKLGFSHPVEMGVPKGMKASTPQPTRILLEGINREQVMTFAADIRRWRVPEPYKGKGIFVNGETIKLKQKKIK